MAPKKLKFENVSSSSSTVNNSDSSDGSKAETYKVDKYKSLSQIEHILTLPDTYIGSIERYQKDGLIYDFENKKIIYKKITQPEGLERIYLEISSNAGDNVQRSRESNINPGNVLFNFTDKTVEVINGGIMIPIEKNADGIWIPDLIFGTLLTSSNYDQNEQKRVCGRNGLGSKLCNVWAKFFSIRIQNATLGKEYYQEWKNNMSEKTEPVIKNYNRKTNIMIVKFEPDFERIYKSGPEYLTSFTKEDIQIFMKHCIDLSFSCNVKVTVNASCPLLKIEYNETFNSGILSYIKHIFPEEKNIVYQNEFCECAIVDIGEDTVHERLLNLSFVNGIITKSGTHINALGNKVANCIIECLSGFNIIKDSDKVLPKLKPRDIISNVSIISSFRLVNPKFSSQTKENLTSAVPAINIKPEYFTTIKKWKLIGHILNTIENKLEREISKTDGKKRKHVKIDSAEDANWAGSSRSKECTLYLIEGDSAMSYAIKYISYTKDGRNNQGCLPLKGKPLNAINATVTHLANNQVFSNIKTMLGLREGINYMDNENFNTLRYGKVVILTDADNDGKHIAGLVLVYFYKRYPSLLQRNDFLQFLRTPIIRAIKGNDNRIYYTDRSVRFDELRGYNIRYFKGLGSSTDKDIKQDVLQAKFINMNMDENAETSLLLTFDDENADDRKLKMNEFLNITEKMDIDSLNPYPISTFIKEEVIEYSIENLSRAIPSLIDGLKDSQRKALYGGFKKFKKNGDILKVAQFAGMIASITDYKHGEKSMEDTIKGMAESYTGSNNLAYFSEHGQFGCVAPDTKILCWDGSIKLAKDITVEDKLIGDDGLIRNISKVVKGHDDMYEINQQYGEKYIVNSQHILTLKYVNHKNIYFKKNKWYMEYFDQKEQIIKTKSVSVNINNNKHFNSSKLSKEQGKENIDTFASTITDNDIFDINIQKYLSLTENQKSYFKSVHNTKPIEWNKRKVLIDPYILGMWIGDGMKSGKQFSSADPELIMEWVKYTKSIDMEVIHYKNINNHEGYQYGLRRKNGKNNNNSYIPLGDSKHSSEKCIGCITSNVKHKACDWYCDENIECILSEEDKNNIKINPFCKYLNYYNLINNKDIPDDYIYNDIETRLQLLAGIIDTDGCLKFKGRKDSELFEISQENEKHGHIIDKLVFIAKSLGFTATISYNENRSKTIQKTLTINGNLSIIPTKLQRKKSIKTYESKKGFNINVKHIGKGDYCGWYLDSNERFLLGDFTVTHNTRNLMGADCASSRYIFTNLRSWVFDCFIEQDFDILEHITTNGEQCEYKYFLPIIPMQLVNGAVGIGTGYSTNIPQYSPYDIIKWLIFRIKKQSPLENEMKMKPWYAGFKGEVTLTNNDTRFTTKGILKRSRDSWIIEEIPISKSIHKYKNFLDDLVEEKEIQDYSNLSQPNSPMFIIKSNTIIDDKKMALTSNHSLSNLVLLDENNRPVVYDNIYQILENWYSYRIVKYRQRKENEIKKMKSLIAKLNMKIKFIEHVLKDEIVIFKQKKEKILEQMRKYEIDEELIKMSIASFTQDEIDGLIKNRDEKQDFLNKYVATPVEQIWMLELSNLLQSINHYYNEVFDSKITENAVLSENKTQLMARRKR